MRVSLERAAPDRSLLDDIPRILAMTPEQRLEEVAHVNRFIAAGRPKDRDDVLLLRELKKKLK